MRVVKIAGLFLILLFGATLTVAQDEGDKAPAKPKAKADEKAKPADGPPEFDVSFSDNSNVKMVILDSTLNLTTRYGKLVIPFADVRRVELGARYPEGTEAKIEAAVAKLNATAFQELKDAEKEILGYKGLAIAPLKKAAKSGDAEVARRAEEMLKTLAKMNPEDRLGLKDMDLVETKDFTIRGRVETTTIKVKTKQFGETTLKFDEVKSLRVTFTGVGTKEITLDAAKYSKMNYTTWMDTEIDVTTEVALEITATGQIDLWPQEPDRYTATPAGGSGNAPGMPLNVMTPPKSGSSRLPRSTTPLFVRSGAIVGKVGASGDAFIVGANFKQKTAPATGRLYLLVAPSMWGNNECTGSYKVSVKVGE